MAQIRPAQLCRSWLFLEGANEAALQRAPASGADVLIHELEDFTPSALRPSAGSVQQALYAARSGDHHDDQQQAEDGQREVPGQPLCHRGRQRALLQS